MVIGKEIKIEVVIEKWGFVMFNLIMWFLDFEVFYGQDKRVCNFSKGSLVGCFGGSLKDKNVIELQFQRGLEGNGDFVRNWYGDFLYDIWGRNFVFILFGLRI